MSANRAETNCGTITRAGGGSTDSRTVRAGWVGPTLWWWTTTSGVPAVAALVRGSSGSCSRSARATSASCWPWRPRGSRVTVADWHTLLKFCGLVSCLLADEEAVYDPRLPDDRVLLGMKG